MNLQCAVYIIFAFIHTFVHSSATDIQKIQICINNPVDEHLVHSKKPLTIFFEGINIRRCAWNWMGKVTVASENFITYESGSSSLSIPSVTKNMSSQWECENENKEKIYFNIRVKFAYVIEVNLIGTIITFALTNQSVKAYDGIYYHECEMGDTIDITCSNLHHNGHIMLQYHDAQGAQITNGHSKEKEKSGLTFRMLVRDKNVSGSYVDCVYVTPINPIEQQFTYRTMFQITNRNPRRSDGFIVIVNDETLTTKIHGTDGADIYTYKYSYEQLLNITCAKKNQLLPGDIHGGIINRQKEDITFQEIVNQTSRYTALITTRNLKHNIFQCYSEFETYKSVARIQLLETNRDPIVLGLTPGKILYEYNIDDMDWIIHYQCTAHEVLNLTCVTGNDRLPEWEYPKYNALEIHTSQVYKTNYINNIFQINTEFNNNITCKSTKLDSKRKVAIVFHQMPDLTPQETNLDADERQSKTLEIIAIIVGVLLVVMCAFCCWRLKKRTRVTKQFSRSAGEDYDRVDELTEQTEGHKYEYIVYNDNTHPNALNANQESSTPIRAPAPPPHSTMPSKNTRFQIPPRGCISHREMEQCRCSTNERSGLECTDIENEYDYVYGVKKQCPCVAPSNRAARKPLRQNGGAVVPHRVPAHQ